MREYSKDKPEAVARILILALLADGTVNRSETWFLERKGVIRRIGLEDEQFDQLFYAFCEDMLSTAKRLSSGQLELDAKNINRLLQEIRDPTLQKETFRTMLDILNADRCLTAGEAALIVQVIQQWGIDLHEVSYTPPPKRRLPPKMQQSQVLA